MTVVQRGTDSSGRPVYATEACWAVWDACCDELGFVPTIVQGGHLRDGADASAGTHLGDAFDLRTWDRTATERAHMIRVFRAHAFAYWERTAAQGFDPHAHMVPGPWASPAPQALDQWNDYLLGLNGLANRGNDYHPTPNPLVTTPPEDTLNATQDQRLKDVENAVTDLRQAADRIEDQQEELLRVVRKMKDGSWLRDSGMKQLLREVLSEVKAEE